MKNFKNAIQMDSAPKGAKTVNDREQSEAEKLQSKYPDTKSVELQEFYDFVESVDRCDSVINGYLQFRIMRALETIAKELNDISEKR